MNRKFSFGIGLVLIILVFISCSSASTQNQTRGTTNLSQPKFLELNLGDNVNFSLFTKVEEEGYISYKLKIPKMVYIFGKQPAEVTVSIDAINKIETINYTYGINGESFFKTDVEKALSLFDEKAIEMGLRLVNDSGMLTITDHTEANLSGMQMSMKIYADDNDVGMTMMVAPSPDGRNFGCLITLTNKLSEGLLVE
jgi:hypothetical protein